MPIMFSTLYADLEAWVARSDAGPFISTFIRLAEPEIYRRVRVFEMEADAPDIVLNDANSFGAAVPTDWLQWRYLYHSGSSNPRTSYVSPDVFHTLNNLPRDGFAELLGDSSLIYTVESGKTKVYAVPGQGDTITLKAGYWQRYTFGGDFGAETCPVLDKHYDVYLYACLKAAWDFFDEPEKIAKYTDKLNAVLDQIPNAEAHRRAPSGAGIRRSTTRPAMVV